MRYITMKNVRPGMVVARPIVNEKGNMLINCGNTISQNMYNRMFEMEIQGIYIEDELSRGIVCEDLIPQSKRREAIKALMNNDMQKVLAFASEVVKELRLKRSLQVNVIDIKNNQNYTYKHCVSCCIYAVVVGITMGLQEEQLKNLAIAAILHDIGKFNLPKHILHKKQELTEEEMKMVKNHPRAAYEKLCTMPEISSVTRNAVLCHHENIDGSGYYGLEAEQQTLVTRILHLVDVYDSLTSVRKFREAYSPSEAIEYIMGNSGKMFDPEVVNAFISKFPLYPIGTTIRLSNNERVIVFSNEINNIRPVVRTMEDTLIDLSTDISYRNVIITGLD